MLNHLNKIKLSYYIRELGLSPQASYNLQRDLMRLGTSLQRERQMLKEEIKKEIFEEISVKTDTGAAIKEIDSLQQAIEKLKGGK